MNGFLYFRFLLQQRYRVPLSLSNLFPHPRVHKLSEEFVQLAAATALTSDCKAFTTKEIFAPRWPHHPDAEPGFSWKLFRRLVRKKLGTGLGKTGDSTRHQVQRIAVAFVFVFLSFHLPHLRVHHPGHGCCDMNVISEKYSSVSMNLTHSAKDSKGKFTMKYCKSKSEGLEMTRESSIV